MLGVALALAATADVRPVVVAAYARIAACSTGTGDVTLSWRIDIDDHAVDMRVANNTFAATDTTAACVRDIVGALQFAEAAPKAALTFKFAAGVLSIVDAGATGLTKQEIRNVIAKAMPAMKHCYEAALNRDAELEGKLMMFWVIDADGGVKTVQVTQDTFASQNAMAPCVTGVITGLRFPKPKGGWPWSEFVDGV
jgi:hypothetical protein